MPNNGMRMGYGLITVKCIYSETTLTKSPILTLTKRK